MCVHISTHITNEKKWRSYRRKIVNEGNISMKGSTVFEIGCSAPICNFEFSQEKMHILLFHHLGFRISFSSQETGICSKFILLKILQASLQEYLNQELPDAQAGFRKGRGSRDQIVNIHWIIEKPREFQKNTYFSFIDYAKTFGCVDHNKLWKFLKRWEYQITLPVS